MKLTAHLLILFLAGCFAANQKPLAPGAMQAVAKAEKFVVRHGFTAAGHPPGLPMEPISLYDGLFGKEETVAKRKDLLKPRAVCVRSLAEVGHSVLFESAKASGSYWIVSIRPESNGWMMHQPLLSMPKDCMHVSQAAS